MKKGGITLLISVILIIYSCAQQKKSYALDRQVKSALDSLSKDNIFWFDETSNFYKFQRFNDVAGNDDLLFLINDKNPLIRCYAFRALAERDDSNVRRIFYDELNDTAIITARMSHSCLVDEMSVREFMLDQLHPVGSNCKFKFSRKEYEKYSELFKKKSSH